MTNNRKADGRNWTYGDRLTSGTSRGGAAMSRRMSGLERNWRLEARRSGRLACNGIANALEYERDAKGWERLGSGVTEAAVEASEMARRQRQIADKFAESAYQNARRAWRWALKSEDAR